MVEESAYVEEKEWIQAKEAKLTSLKGIMDRPALDRIVHLDAQNMDMEFEGLQTEVGDLKKKLATCLEDEQAMEKSLDLKKRLVQYQTDFQKLWPMDMFGKNHVVEGNMRSEYRIAQREVDARKESMKRKAALED
jgi:septation ring formation regulator EzrA